MKTCHKMKVYGRFDSTKRIRPEIRLLGHWLTKVGFEAGSEISVTILDDRILIERHFRDEGSLNELASYFEKEAKKDLRQEPDVVRWVREQGGVKPNTVSSDIQALTGRECGFRGRSSIVRPNGKALDVLCQEAQWQGIVSEGTSTDDFTDMLKSRVEG